MHFFCAVACRYICQARGKREPWHTRPRRHLRGTFSKVPSSMVLFIRRQFPSSIFSSFPLSPPLPSPPPPPPPPPAPVVSAVCTWKKCTTRGRWTPGACTRAGTRTSATQTRAAMGPRCKAAAAALERAKNYSPPCIMLVHRKRLPCMTGGFVFISASASASSLFIPSCISCPFFFLPFCILVFSLVCSCVNF